MIRRLFLLSSLLVAVSGSFAHAACSWSEEEQLARETKDRFNRGEMTATEVYWADLNLLEARYGCRQVALIKYCASARDLVRLVRNGVNEELRVGHRTIRDVIEVQRTRRAIEKTCDIIPE